MPGANVIKEYLISLKHTVDNSSYAKFQGVLKGMESKFNKTFKASGLLVTGLTAITTATYKMMSGVADQDREMNKLSRTYGVAKDGAMSYTATLKAMGVTMKDVMMDKELAARFNELYASGKRMSAPDDMSKQMSTIKDIQTQFVRMKMMGQYAMQWISYYLTKYLEGPFNRFKNGFKSFLDTAEKKMPNWTKKVAEIISWVIRFGEATFRTGGIILGLLDKIPREAKVAFVAIGGAMKLLSMGPLGLLLAGLAAIILLIDDFQTWKSGGESLFGDMWADVDKYLSSGILQGAFDGLMGSSNDLFGSMKDLGAATWDFLDAIAKAAGYDNPFELIMDSAAGLISSLSGVIELINQIISFFQGKGFDGNKILSKASGTADKIATGIVKKVLGKDHFEEGETIGSISRANEEANSPEGQIAREARYKTMKENAKEYLANIPEADARYDFNQPKKQPPSYTMSPSGGKSINVEQNNDFKIYANDPVSTGKVIDQNQTQLLQRAFGGGGAF